MAMDPPSSGAAVLRHLRRAGLDLAYLGGALITSMIAFVVWVAGLSITVSLLVLIVGFLVAIGMFWLFRWTVELDRRLIVLVRPEQIRGVYRSPSSDSLLDHLRTVVSDPQSWKDTAWLIVHSGVGFAAGLAAITLVLLWLGLVTIPLWWNLPDGTSADVGAVQVDSLAKSMFVCALALASTPAVMVCLRGMALGHSKLAIGLLGPSEKQLLNARVSELSRSRAGAVDAAREQLERIEQDLHDGAQARMVAVAMELGLAEEELESLPEEAREPIRRARAGALAALEELRDLSRGIRPALLAERGLPVALEALAERSPLPTELRVEGPVPRFPANVETAAYFVVSEALANAAKHSGSGHATVTLAGDGERLAVTVADRGRGGADPAGSGLRGLRSRVEALDGELRVTSPAGGPTTVAASIPSEREERAGDGG